MNKRLPKLKRLSDVRPLVLVFEDSDALLQFIEGCRRLRPQTTAALYRLRDEYRLLYEDPTPMPPSLWALAQETAHVRGGFAAFAATAAEGVLIRRDAVLTENECARPDRADLPL